MRIDIPLSIEGIHNARKQLERYRKQLERKRLKFLRELAKIGVNEAEVRFNNALYPSVDNDVKVESIPTSDGYKVVANGQAVCFIEFGAGVTYNSNSDYPITKPNGIVGIGEYGKGRGANPKGWYYTNSSGESKHTYGNPAEMPMYCASREMRSQITAIAREVFSTDD